MVRKRGSHLSSSADPQRNSGTEREPVPVTPSETTVPEETEGVAKVVEDAEIETVETVEAVVERIPEGSLVSPTKADLEAAIVDLKVVLETARQTARDKENTLLQQIATLQANVQAQQSLIETLKTELQHSSQLKVELEEAKKMILQLSQVNAKPAVPTSNPRPLEVQQAAEPELESAAKPAQLAQRKLEGTGRDRPKSHQMELRKILNHPTPPGNLPSMPSEKLSEKVKLSDTDMGWVD
ncbi:MAG: hypothetical protein HC769_02100 [Cyanobacteria bacterium CRU_2_1]|nr:hypothetical protein [Cyanobacteria bacterium RU_5_0]NJR57747.1 hypothetical protein [Cyanobacteria bacterium CRU_2_1]